MVITSCGLVMLTCTRGQTLQKALPVALAAVVVIDVTAMFATPQFSAPRQATFDVKPVEYLAHHLGTERFFTLGPIAPNYGSYFGLGSVAVNDVPIPKSYQAFIESHLNTNVDPLVFDGSAMTDPSGPTPQQELSAHLSAYQAVGVKYVIMPTGTQLPTINGRSFRTVFSDSAATIVVLPHPAPLFSSDGNACSITPQSPTIARLDCRRRSTVIYRELFMPGWHASVGGRSTTVHAHGTLFQSVEVPAGRSTLEFAYSPPGASLAFLAFALGVVGVTLSAVPLEKVPLPWRRRRLLQ